MKAFRFDKCSLERWYFVCNRCDAKWFSRQRRAACPRCRARGPNPRLPGTKIVCLYKEKDGHTWKETTNFDRDDLPLVAKVADLSHTWIFTYCQDQNRSQRPEPADATNEAF